MTFFYDFLFIIGTFVIFLYVFILIKSKIRQSSKQTLIAFLLLSLFVLIDSYAYMHQLQILTYISFLPAYNAKLLIGPLLVLYVKSLFFDQHKFLKNSFRLFIPSIIFFILLSLPIFINLLERSQFPFFSKILRDYNGYVRILTDVILLGYLYFSFTIFSKVESVSKNNFSYDIGNYLVIGKYILIATTSVIFLDMFFATSQLVFEIFLFRTQNIITASLVFCLLLFAYYGTRKSNILIPYFLVEENKKEEIEIHFNQNLEEEFQVLNDKLDEIIKNKKPYLDPELTLDLLAKEVETTNKKLSKFLNQYLKISFYDYINTHRIAVFKERIVANEFKDLTTEGLAYECGFKSKASFYRCFKREIGMSPSEYKKKVKN